MLRHMVLFRFRREADASARSAVLDGLARLPTLFPAIERFGLGENISERDQTFSHVMTMEFGTRRDLDSYLASTVHERFVAEVFRPVVEHRAIASYECG